MTEGVPQTGKTLPKLVIMVVDDDKAILEAMELAISLTENESVCFSNSLEAIENFEKEPSKYQGIFTDLRMPNLTGEGLLTHKIL